MKKPLPLRFLKFPEFPLLWIGLAFLLSCQSEPSELDQPAIAFPGADVELLVKATVVLLMGSSFLACAGMTKITLDFIFKRLSEEHDALMHNLLS